MKCPNCGHAMNHHADKVLVDIPEVEDGASSPRVEAFTCPHCGTNASKVVSNL